MNFDIAQFWARARHPISALGGALVMFGIMQQGDLANALKGADAVVKAIVDLAAALALLIPAVNAIIAGRAASPQETVKRALEAAPDLVIREAVAKAPASASEQVAAAAPREAMKAVADLPQVELVVAKTAAIAASVPSPAVVAPDQARESLSP